MLIEDHVLPSSTVYSNIKGEFPVLASHRINSISPGTKPSPPTGFVSVHLPIHAEIAAAVAELAAFVAEVDALASAVSNPDASTENSKPVPPAFADNTLPATISGNVRLNEEEEVVLVSCCYFVFLLYLISHTTKFFYT